MPRPYALQVDLTRLIPSNTLIDLTDDAGNNTTNTTTISACITDADDEIDGYLGKVFEVPLSTTVGLVNKLSTDIAIYNLYSRTKETIPETRQTRYENAIETLQGIVDGTISIGIEPQPDKTTTEGIQFNRDKDEDRIFTTSTLTNYFTDI